MVITTGRTPAANRRLAQWLVQNFADILKQDNSLILQMNFCGKNRALWVAVNW